MLRSSYHTISATLTGVAVATAISIQPCEVRATNLVSIGTFRETIESPHVYGSTSTNTVTASKPVGTVTLWKQGVKQIFEVDIRNLSSALNPSNFNWGVYLNLSTVFVTNDLVTLLCQLDRTNAGGHWVARPLPGIGQAPLFEASILDLDELTGRIISIGFPSMDGTNPVIRCVLWAPIPPLVSIPKAASYSRQLLLTRPDVALSPKATGNLRYSYLGTTGRSVVDLYVKNLTRGHDYGVWLTLTTTNDAAYPGCIMDFGPSSCITNIASLKLSESTKNGRYVRDTRRGDSLPLQLNYAGDLSDRLILIVDTAGATHLGGVIP
jgi:hypothetical protein